MPSHVLQDNVFTIDIAVPRQRVWDEITTTGRIQLALNNTVLEGRLTPGSKLRYYSPDKKRVFVVGEVVEVTPPKRFTHTFRLLMQANEAPSLVTWDLEETTSGCRVTLTHSGWTNQVRTHKGTAGGWVGILKVLKQHLETGDIPWTTKLLYAAMGAMMFLLPKATKVEEVERRGW
ncbi:MAG: SRPBCC domain-containing protein [Vicinamibacterales bacterium]